MDLILEFLSRLVTQFQSPTLGFLFGGMLLAATGSKLQIPDPIYKFCVYMLLMRIGLEGGMEIREARLEEMLLPAVIAVLVGCAIVFAGRFTLAALPGVRDRGRHRDGRTVRRRERFHACRGHGRARRTGGFL